MKQKEFFQLIDQYGLNLNKLSISVGKVSSLEGAHGVYEKNGKWFYFFVDEKNRIKEKLMKGEDDAFNKLFKRVFTDLDAKHYLTKAIDEEIIKIEKDAVCRFIRDNYFTSEHRANDFWNYLKQDMRALFEFKYYIATGRFVPEKYCYRVRGCSAEEISKASYLEALPAFNYLVYLKGTPKRCLRA